MIYSILKKIILISICILALFQIGLTIDGFTFLSNQSMVATAQIYNQGNSIQNQNTIHTVPINFQKNIDSHSTYTKQSTIETSHTIIQKYIDSMTLEEAVGQLFLIGHWDEDNFYNTTNLLRAYNFGGVIIMKVSNDNINHIPNWITSWKADSTIIPPIIGIDQEGGVVNRIHSSDYLQTSQRDILSPEQAYSLGIIRGEELKKIGINVNLAPVLDISSSSKSFMYKRSFANSKETALYAGKLITGMRMSGVTAVPKHYPGHYDNTQDSHSVLPILPIQKKDFSEYTKYFTEVFEKYNPPIIMTSHVLIPDIDPIYPVTLSYKVLTNMLRTKNNFSGIIMTDDITMGAISNQWTPEEATIQAINAGADIILFASQPNQAIKGRNAILNAVKQGDISVERIHESVYRILEFKYKYLVK